MAAEGGLLVSNDNINNNYRKSEEELRPYRPQQSARILRKAPET